MRLIDITGQTFGRLTVLRKHPKPSMWECSCSCGGITLATGTNLRRGNTSSCGCLHKEKLVAYNQATKTLPEIWRADMNYYVRKLGYRRNKKSKGLGTNQFSEVPREEDHSEHPSLQWDLNLQEYTALVTSDCHYCGQPPAQRAMGRSMPSDLKKNGIDRKNNDLGYTPDNCVPCCASCNRAKNAKSLQQFVDDTRRRYEHMIHTGLITT